MLYRLNGQHRLTAANITAKQVLDLQRKSQDFYVVFFDIAIVLITTDEDHAVKFTAQLDKSQLYIVKGLFDLTSIFNKREYEYEHNP